MILFWGALTKAFQVPAQSCFVFFIVLRSHTVFQIIQGAFQCEQGWIETSSRCILVIKMSFLLCAMNIQESDALLELFLKSLGGFLDITTVVCIDYVLEIFHPMESSGLKGQHPYYRLRLVGSCVGLAEKF